MSVNSSWDDADFTGKSKYKTKKDRGRYPKIYKNLRICVRCNNNDLCNDDGVCAFCNRKAQTKTNLVL